MERENYLGTIQSKSRFEESAGSKISDTRHHDSVISDRNKVTANGLDHARTIHEKLNEHKYAAADSPTPVTTDTSYVVSTSESDGESARYVVDEPIGYRTETELHSGSGASSNLYQTPEPVQTKAGNRGQSYIAMLQRDKEKHPKNTGRHRTQERSHFENHSTNKYRHEERSVSDRNSADRYHSDSKAHKEVRTDRTVGRETGRYDRHTDSAGYSHMYKDSATSSFDRTYGGVIRCSNVVGPYVSYGKYGRANTLSIERGAMQGGRYAWGKNTAYGRLPLLAKGQLSGKYISVGDSKRPLSRTEIHVNAQRFKTYSSIYLNKLTTRDEMSKGLQRHITLDSSNRATQRLKRYRVSIGRAEDFEGEAVSYVTKKGTIIPSKIAQKAKGTEETKAKTLAKLTKDQKATFSKKTVGTKGATGKFKKKIAGGVNSGAGKIRDVALGAAAYKIAQDDESNAAVKAMLASGNASYQVSRKITAKANNANAQKFFEKIKGKGKDENHSTGKYAFKAKHGVSDATSKEAKKKAVAQAQKKAQQMKILKKFRLSKIKEIESSNVFQEVKQAAIKVAKKLLEWARRNAAIIISVASFLIVFIVVVAGLSSCAMALTQGAGTYMSGTSGTKEYDMTDSDSYFRKKEMELQEKMDNIEEDYPDFDEYVLDIADIGHDATKLMAYLTAKYESYTLADVQAELDELFDLIYIITIEEETEIRTRMVEKEAEDGTKYEVEEEYEWKILYVTLEKKDFDDIVTPRLPDDNSKEMYDIYKDTGGAHQAFYNPFTVDWSEHVSSEFGWRIHPITGKEKFHNGIDIALPTGTEVHASSSGTVIQSYYSESAGNYVVVQDETGYTAHYMHLSTRSVSVGDVIKHGEIIGKVGSTGNSTGPHLHFGVKDASGEWINPRFVLSDFVKN